MKKTHLETQCFLASIFMNFGLDFGMPKRHIFEVTLGLFSILLPRSAQEPSKRPQERPKGVPRAPKSVPRASKSASKAPKSDPRATKTYPGDAQGDSRGVPFCAFLCFFAFFCVFSAVFCVFLRFYAFFAFFCVFLRRSVFICVVMCLGD